MLSTCQFIYIYLHWFYTEPKNYFFEFYYNFLLVVQCFGEGLWVSDDLEVQVKYRWASKVNPVLVLNVQLRWNNTLSKNGWPLIETTFHFFKKILSTATWNLLVVVRSIKCWTFDPYILISNPAARCFVETYWFEFF